MGLLGSLVMRYSAEGHQDVIRADKRVRDSISVTARHAKRDEATTKGWLQRHKTALLAVAGSIGAAMYAIARESPSMSAALGEIRLAFSMFFMDVGERASPFFDYLADLAWGLLEKWEGLPDGLKNILVRGAPAIVEEWDGLLTGLAKKVDEIFGTGDTFQGLTQGIVSAIKTTWGTVTAALSEAWSGTLDTLRTHWEAFKEDPIAWGVSLVTGFVQGIHNQVEGLYNYVVSVLAILRGKFTSWLPDAKQWGADLLQNFINGIRSMFGLLSSTISTVKSMIEDVISFDIAANDRMAYRWGADMMRHFEAGAMSVPFAPNLAAPALAGGAPASAAGNQTIYVDIGGITISGTSTQGGLDEAKLSRLVRDEIGQALRSRGR